MSAATMWSDLGEAEWEAERLRLERAGKLEKAPEPFVWRDKQPEAARKR